MLAFNGLNWNQVDTFSTRPLCEAPPA